jgi:PKD repeat protein
MRIPHALALVLGVTGLGTACGGDRSGPSNTPPAAAFTPSCVLLVCTFADGSTDADGQVMAYSWNFGDGAAAATTRDAQHTFAAANTYTVSLTVTDNDGAADGVTHSVQVTAPANARPTANFAGSCVVVGGFGRIAFFDCTYTDQSTAAAGATVTAWAWDLGDGRTSTEQNPPVHHYSISWRPGVRVAVTLTVTDNNGLTDSVTRSVPVSTQANATPTANFTSSCADLACSFTDLSSDGDGTVVGFQWDFGDGAVAAIRNPSHAFASAGTYVVALTVTDDRGATGTLSQPVSVTDPQAAAPAIGLVVSPLLRNLCYPARSYSVRGCPSGGYVTISNAGGGTLNWTSTTSASWLKRSPTSGTAPSTIKVWVDGTALPPGPYSGDITVSATGATNSPRGVSVHVTRY